MRVGLWRRESPEEARRQRLVRKMLRLPPEPVCHHVLAGFATLGALAVAHRYGSIASVAVVAGPTPSALANSDTSR
jgi:hypothetical protein